jgi:hypothetical protein
MAQLEARGDLRDFIDGGPVGKRRSPVIQAAAELEEDGLEGADHAPSPRRAPGTRSPEDLAAAPAMLAALRSSYPNAGGIDAVNAEAIAALPGRLLAPLRLRLLAGESGAPLPLESVARQLGVATASASNYLGQAFKALGITVGGRRHRAPASTADPTSAAVHTLPLRTTSVRYEEIPTA